MQPSYAPTQAPSLSFETQWEHIYSSYEYSGYFSAPRVKSLVFADLSLGHKQVRGTCSEWSVFVDFSLTSTQLTHVLSYMSLHHSDAIVNAHSLQRPMQCSERDVIKRIFDAVKDLHDNILIGQRNFICEERTWSAVRCFESSHVVVCVDCPSYCSLSASQRSSTVAVSCSDTLSSPMGQLDVLVVGFDELYPAPAIIDMSVQSVSKHSLDVTLHINGSGSLVCGAYPIYDDIASLSADMILLSNAQIDVSGGPVTYSISGLLPSTVYGVYCATLSPTQARLDTAAVLGTKRVGETQCCREVRVALTSTSLVDYQDALSALLVDIGRTRPSEWLQIDVSAIPIADAAGVAVLDGTPVKPFQPARIEFSSTSIVASSGMAYVRVASGFTYSLEVTLSGPSTGEYSVVYPNGQTFSVMDSEHVPATPVPRSAVFSPDGSRVLLTFRESTDKMRGAAVIRCKTVITFIGMQNAARCIWTDASTLEIYVGSSQHLDIGGTITLLAGTVKSACTSVVNPTCSHWPSNSEESVEVQAPLNPLRPVVVISAPPLIGPCDDYTFHLTASSGTGGRDWKSVTVDVQSTHPNASQLQAFLTNRTELAKWKPVSVPPSLLQGGTVYNLVVTMCNFLGSCGRAARSLTVSAFANVPVVSLNSQERMVLHRNSTMTISAYAYMSLCGGGISRANLEYSWTAKKSDGAALVLPSNYANPRELSIPAYTLQVGQLYTISLSVRHKVSMRSSASTVQVFVQPGSIVSVVRGGLDRGLRIDEELLLDAGDSYDEDVFGLTGSNAGLVFSFVCTQIFPLYQATCPLTQRTDSSTAIVIGPGPSGSVSVGDVFFFEVTSRSSNPFDLRSSSVMVKVAVLDSLAPVISIQSATGLRINPNTKLKLVANVAVKASGQVSWSVSDPTVSLAAKSLSPVSKALAYTGIGDTEDSFAVSLVLPANTLPQRSTFTFTITCDLENHYSHAASIVITTNAPPVEGVFDVTPSIGGFMLDTVFLLEARQWVDSGMLLQWILIMW